MQTYTYDGTDYSYREFHIKKKNGKTRRLCAPNAALKAYQRSKLPALVALFKVNALASGVSVVFHGFLPDRNCVTCAAHHIGYAHTISMDISNCFDSIAHMHPFLTHEDGTLAQGFPTSPILANIYLIYPAIEIQDKLTQLYGENTFAFTIYADDVTISVPESSYQKLNIIKQIVVSIMASYNLTINPSKTRIHHSKFGNRRILGLMVGETSVLPTRKTKKKIRAARHQSNGPSLGGLRTWSLCLLPRSLRT